MFQLDITLRFEACHLNERISFKSSDPKFSVGPDGSLYAEQDVTNLSESIQFMVTAQGSKDSDVWETIVKLVVTRHPHPPFINQVSSHHNRYHHLSQQQPGFSTNGLHWKTRDRVISPISAPANPRRDFPLFCATVSDRSSFEL
ncbi:cadherin-4 isoform X1 [Tachysurus ichikawai]